LLSLGHFVVVDTAVGIVALVAVVTFVTALSRRFPVPAPLVLTIVGVVGSFLPWVPQVRLSPEIVLVGFLPPLLYAAALNTSLIDFRKNARPIGLLSVGLVIFTTVTVAPVVHAVLPVPWSAAFALGAVVAPPDAVAASAIARRVGMPRRLVTILQGESLVNDATALVALRTAIAAGSGTVSLIGVAGDFLLTAFGGFAIGLGVAYVTGKVRRRITDEVTDTAVSMITPFVAYLIAEQFHLSGVLAVVVTGLRLGHHSHLMQSASSRVFERTNWATVEFLLENTVFLLIGLQVREILTASGRSPLPVSQIVAACAAVTLTVVLVRPIWVFPATYVSRMVPGVRERDPRPPWGYPAALSWAGMRGVVTLAAVFVLPAGTPQREVLILVALVVVGATLLLQGSTLPWVLRRLDLRGPDPGQDALEAAAAHQHATLAGLARLEEVTTPDDAEDVVARVRRRIDERAEAMWERLGSSAETPSEAYARLRMEVIQAQRAELVRLRDNGSAPEDVLRRVFNDLDIEETVLDFRRSLSREGREQEMIVPRGKPSCGHLDALADPPPPDPLDGCGDCLAEGLQWVHLRLCMTCGRVGCCDSSVGKHAARHYHSTSHPVVRSFEAGEGWRWCYVDEVVG
jgi:monovalent cation/hydrogen antiporter